MDKNFFSTRDQYIFICYKDVIKHCYPIMLNKIIHEYYNELNELLYLDVIKDYDIYNLERLCIERTDVNPFRYLKRDICTNETADLLLETFEDEMFDMYTQSKFTNFGSRIFNLVTQPQIKELYIYVERPITQIMYDCKTYFEQFGNKIKYVCGDFIDVIKKLPNKPTSYILNDADYIKDLIDNKFIEFTEIIIAELGYNFEVSEDKSIVLKNGYEDLMEEHIFKIGYFPTLMLEDKHFSCLHPK
jgi:hypothetical protein